MELRDYVRIFRRRWRSIALLVVLGLLAGLAFTLLSPKVYAAQSKVYVTLTQVSSGSAYQSSQFVLSQMPSYAQLDGSPQVLEPVITKLGLHESAQNLATRVSITNPTSTVYLDVDVTAASPRAAKRLANATGSELATVIEGLQSTQTSTRVVTARRQAATGSAAAVSPKLSLDLVLGLVVGLILGLIIAIVRHRLDTSIRGVDDVHDLAGVAPLVSVPAPEDATAGGEDGPEDAVSRRRLSAFRELRTDLALASGGHLPPSVLVAAVDSADGLDVAVHLARVAARSGIRTCLVEADLRNPRLAGAVSNRPMTGLTAVLEGRVDLAEAVLSWPDDPARGPAVLVGGRPADDPADLLDSAVMARAHRVLAATFDLVLYVSPPASDGSDAAILGRDCASTVLVVRAGTSARQEFAAAAGALDAVGASVAGVVLVEAPRAGSARRRARKHPEANGDVAPLGSGRLAPVALTEPSVPFAPQQADHFSVPVAGGYRAVNAAHFPASAVGMPPRARSSRSRRAATAGVTGTVEAALHGSEL